MLKKIAAVRVFVQDIESARYFYGGILEMALAFDQGDTVGFQLGENLLILERVDLDDAEGASYDGRFTGLSFQVDDIAHACQEMERKGVAFLTEPAVQAWSGVVAHFSDLDGNILTLVEMPI